MFPEMLPDVVAEWMPEVRMRDREIERQRDRDKEGDSYVPWDVAGGGGGVDAGGPGEHELAHLALELEYWVRQNYLHFKIIYAFMWICKNCYFPQDKKHLCYSIRQFTIALVSLGNMRSKQKDIYENKKESEYGSDFGQ